MLLLCSSLLDVNLEEFREIVKDREVWQAAVHGVSKS